MKLEMILKLSWRNFLRNWRHSLASLIAITSGFTAVSVFDGFIGGVNEQLRDGFIRRGMLGHLVVGRVDVQNHATEDNFDYAMTKEEQEFLDRYFQNDPDFLRRVRVLNISGMVSNGTNNAVFVGAGFDQEDGAAARGERWEWNAVAGLPLRGNSVDATLIGSGLGLQLGCESTTQENVFRKGGGFIPAERPFKCPNDYVQLSVTTEHSQANAMQVKIIGMTDAGLREVNNRWISLPLPTAQRLFDTDRVTMMGVALKREESAPEFKKRLEKAIEQSKHRLEVIPWEKHYTASKMKNAINVVMTFRTLFSVVVASIAILTIANTLLKSVTSRIREIATLRSFGFSKQIVHSLFVFEAIFVNSFAVLSGWGLSLLLSYLINALELSYRAGLLSTPIPLQIVVVPWTWIVSTLALYLLVGLTAYVASGTATKISIVDGLKYH